MRYIFISKYGESLFLARYLSRDYEVYVYIDDKESRDKYRGMDVDMKSDFWPVLEEFEDKKSTTILYFDMSGLGTLASHLMEDGWNVYGACSFADKLEEDRDYAVSLLGQIMETPPTYDFDSFAAARKFLAKQDDETRFVFKPEGEEMPTGWTHVGKNHDDLLDRLLICENQWPKNQPVKFILQEFVKGIEADFNGYFNGEKWIEGGFQWYFEDKKQLDGNLGPSVGCADAVQYFTSSKEPYFQDIMSKLTPVLRENNFHGQFAINNIISEKDHKPYFLEISARQGYDSAQNEFYGIIANREDPAVLINAVALGRALPKDYFPTDYMMDIRVYIPPYPSSESTKESKGHIINFDPEVEDNFIMHDVNFNEEIEKYECAGTECWLGVVATMAPTIDGCMKDLYENILPALNVSELGYRTDAGKRVKKDIEKLAEWGVILPKKDPQTKEVKSN